MSEPDQRQEDLEPIERIAVGVERIGKELERLPRRFEDARHHGERTSSIMGRMEEGVKRAEAEHKTARAERRANIAIALTAVTALSGLIAAIATLA
jgi:predicted hydrolase (HD superfamily)